jgi:hypothetical protein
LSPFHSFLKVVRVIFAVFSICLTGYWMIKIVSY